MTPERLNLVFGDVAVLDGDALRQCLNPAAEKEFAEPARLSGSSLSVSHHPDDREFCRRGSWEDVSAGGVDTSVELEVFQCAYEACR